MATKTKTQASDAIPAGYTPLDSFAQKMEMEIGLEFEGVLGPVAPSKRPGFKDYRTVKVIKGTIEPGTYFLPTHAALTHFMAYPDGTEIFARLTGGAGVKDDPYTWQSGVKR